MLLVTVLLCLQLTANASAKELVGWVENAVVYPGALALRAKLDTGAKTSSLDSQNMTSFKRDGKEWLAFSIRNHEGHLVRLEKPLLRIARVKRHFGTVQTRYVVQLGICLGSTYRDVEVTLVDRSGFNYPLLIGRNYLQNGFLVDPGSKNLTSPACNKVPD